MLKIIRFHEQKIPLVRAPVYFRFYTCFSTFFIEKHLTITIFNRFFGIYFKNI